MALLKEDNQFTHVIAIDFGTGASGLFWYNSGMLLHLNILTKMEKFVYKFSTRAMEVMIRKPQLQFYLIMMGHLLISEQMPSKNMLK